MGNRCEVHFKNDDDQHVIYLHWNGGPESVVAFLETMRERKWDRMDYASARFVSVVGEFFDADGNGDGCSLGLFDAVTGAGDDNGLYEVESISPLRLKQRGRPVDVGRVIEDEQCIAIIKRLQELRAARKK